ncbi:MAG: hypothetical protein WCB31_07045 [Nitrososphaeraceae archaeon]
MEQNNGLIRFYDVVALSFKDNNELLSAFVTLEYMYNTRSGSIKYVDIQYSDRRLEKHIEQNPNVIRNVDSYLRNKLLRLEYDIDKFNK